MIIYKLFIISMYMLVVSTLVKALKEKLDNLQYLQCSSGTQAILNKNELKKFGLIVGSSSKKTKQKKLLLQIK